MANPAGDIITLPNGETKTLPKPQSEMTSEDWKQFFNETDRYLEQQKSLNVTTAVGDNILLPNGETKQLPKPRDSMSRDDWDRFFKETDSYLSGFQSTPLPPEKPNMAAVKDDQLQKLLEGWQPELPPEAKPSDKLAYETSKLQADLAEKEMERLQQQSARRSQADQQISAAAKGIEPFYKNGMLDKSALLNYVESELKAGRTPDWFFQWYPQNYPIQNLISDAFLEERANNPLSRQPRNANERYANLLARDKSLFEKGYQGSTQELRQDLPSEQFPVDDIPEIIRSPLADVAGGYAAGRDGFEVPLNLAFAMAADDPAKADILDKKLGPFAPYFEYTVDKSGAPQVYVKSGLQEAVKNFREANQPTDPIQLTDLNALSKLKDGEKFYINRPGASRQDFVDFIGSIPTQIAAYLPAAKAIKGGSLLASLARGGLSGAGGSVLQDLIAENMGSNEGISGVRAGLGALGGAVGDALGSVKSPGLQRYLNKRNPERVNNRFYDQGARPTESFSEYLAKMSDQGADYPALEQLGGEYLSNLKENINIANGDVGQAIRLTDANSLGVPLTRSQLTQNPQHAAIERWATSGNFGKKYSDIAKSTTEAQEQAFDKAATNILGKYKTSPNQNPVDRLSDIRSVLASKEEALRNKKNALYEEFKKLNTNDPNPVAVKGSLLYDLRQNINDYLRNKEFLNREDVPRSFNVLDTVDNIIRDVSASPKSGISTDMIAGRGASLKPGESFDDLAREAGFVTKRNVGVATNNERLRGLTLEEQDQMIRDLLLDKTGGKFVNGDDLKKLLDNLSPGELDQMAERIKTPLQRTPISPVKPGSVAADRVENSDEIAKTIGDYGSQVQAIDYTDLAKIEKRIDNQIRNAGDSADNYHLNQIKKMYKNLVENKLLDDIASLDGSLVVSGDKSLIKKYKDAKIAAREHAALFRDDSVVERLIEKVKKPTVSLDDPFRDKFVLDGNQAANVIMNMEQFGLKREAGEFIDKLKQIAIKHPDFNQQIDDVKGAIIGGLWRQALNKSPKTAGEATLVKDAGFGARLASNIWKATNESKETFAKIFSPKEISELKQIARVASAIAKPVEGAANPSGSGYILEEFLAKYPLWGRLAGKIYAIGNVVKRTVSPITNPVIPGVRVLPSSLTDVVGGTLSGVGNRPMTDNDIRRRRTEDNPLGLTEEFLQKMGVP